MEETGKKKHSISSTLAALLFIAGVVMCMGAPAYDMITGIMAARQQVSVP